jgi:hypothetical protein
LEHLGDVILPGALFANPPAFPYSSRFSNPFIPIKNPLRIKSKKDERKNFRKKGGAKGKGKKEEIKERRGGGQQASASEQSRSHQ